MSLGCSEVPQQVHSTPLKPPRHSITWRDCMSLHSQFIVTFSCFTSQIKYISWIAQIIHHRAIFTALRWYTEWLKNKQFITLLQLIYYSAIRYTITRRCLGVSGRSACKYISTYEKEGKKEIKTLGKKQTKKTSHYFIVNINLSCVLHSGTATSFFVHKPLAKRICNVFIWWDLHMCQSQLMVRTSDTSFTN